MESFFAAMPAIAALLDDSDECFDSWANERESGVFNANSNISKERGASAYGQMGHGFSGNDFMAAVALREMLQNSSDAGATRLKVGVDHGPIHIQDSPRSQVGLFCSTDSATVAVYDNVPAERRLSTKVFTDVFMTMDASSKPGASSGGKGQARVMLSTCDGLFMAGHNGFKATVGVRYAASTDDSMQLSTFRTCTEAQRFLLTKALEAVPSFNDGGLVAVRVKGCTGGLANCLSYFLSLFNLPGLSFDFNGTKPHPARYEYPMKMPELLVESKTLYLETKPGRVKVVMGITNSPTATPYPLATRSNTVMMHVRCRDVLMFTRDVVVHEMCNSDRLVLVIDLESADARISNAEIFTMQRSDLRADRLGVGCDGFARLAIKEFEGRLHRPVNSLMTGRTAGRPILAGIPAAIMCRLRLKVSAGAVACLRTGDVDIRLNTARDVLDPSTKMGKLANDIAGAGFSVPVTVSNTGKKNAQGELVFGPDATFCPDAVETALARYCALLATLMASKFSRPVPAVGILFTDDNSLHGLATGEGIFLNVTHLVSKLKQNSSNVTAYRGMVELLNELSCTVAHEMAHKIADLSQSHSRLFWDTHVDLLKDTFIKNAVIYLTNVLVCKPALDDCTPDALLDELVRRLSVPEEEEEVIVIDSDSEQEDVLDLEWQPQRAKRRKSKA